MDNQTLQPAKNNPPSIQPKTNQGSSVSGQIIPQNPPVSPQVPTQTNINSQGQTEFNRISSTPTVEPALKGFNSKIPPEKNQLQDELTKAVKTRPIGVKIIPQKSGKKIRGIIKLVLLIVLPIGLAVGGALTASQYIDENTYREQKNVLLAVSMQNTNWQDLGTIFEPLVDLPIKTTNGHQTNKFLLDSGAVVSSLPREWAEKTGQDLAFLPRSTFRGFGGKTSFAYQGEMMVLLGEEDVSLPVVFTEAANTKSLLGRKGFFENYSVYFNHKEKRIEIRE